MRPVSLYMHCSHEKTDNVVAPLIKIHLDMAIYSIVELYVSHMMATSLRMVQNLQLQAAPIFR